MTRHRATALLSLLGPALLLGQDGPHVAGAIDDALYVGGPRPCPLRDSDLAWTRNLLALWTESARTILRHEHAPLPWIVVFDKECEWHLNADAARIAQLGPELRDLETELRFRGRAVRVRSRLHGGQVWLPSGARISAGPHAAASLYADSSPFFALALREIWEDVVTDREEIPDLGRFFLGVAAHELVHTLQLPRVAARIRGMRDTLSLPEDLDDDVVERAFADDSAYIALFRRELDLLRRAAETEDRSEKIELVRAGLAAARERRARFFQGRNSFYGPLEALFLNMEGVAVWTHYRLHQLRPELVHFEARGNSSWVQDEGFVLFRLIDQLHPEWRGRVLGSELASPFDLLAEAVVDRRGGKGA